MQVRELYSIAESHNLQISMIDQHTGPSSIGERRRRLLPAPDCSTGARQIPVLGAKVMLAVCALASQAHADSVYAGDGCDVSCCGHGCGDRNSNEL